MRLDRGVETPVTTVGHRRSRATANSTRVSRSVRWTVGVAVAAVCLAVAGYVAARPKASPPESSWISAPTSPAVGGGVANSPAPVTSSAAAPSAGPVSPPSAAPPASGLPAPVSCPGCWRPPLVVSWNWVIAEVPSAPFRNVQMYDIDGFEAQSADVSALHAAGKKVVCYISAGSWEDWRPDAGQFPTSVRGKDIDGWPGERWLDIRDVRRPDSALAAIMNARLDMCRGKGFDAVEFDLIDGYTNPTGFPLTANDQMYYNVFLANGARQRGLSAVMKNDVEQVDQLVTYFDMALNEQCNEYDECSAYAAFTRVGKPVFNAEYVATSRFCAADNAANLNGGRFARDLDDSTFEPCR
jgi:hypothetical protein